MFKENEYNIIEVGREIERLKSLNISKLHGAIFHDDKMHKIISSFSYSVDFEDNAEIRITQLFEFLKLVQSTKPAKKLRWIEYIKELRQILLDYVLSHIQSLSAEIRNDLSSVFNAGEKKAITNAIFDNVDRQFESAESANDYRYYRLVCEQNRIDIPVKESISHYKKLFKSLYINICNVVKGDYRAMSRNDFYAYTRKHTYPINRAKSNLFKVFLRTIY